jgi:subtilisin family serine protease
MNIKKALFSLAFVAFLIAASGAHAASTQNPVPDTRYFIKSTSQIWKKTFLARNFFDSGFTAELSDFQLKIARVFGLEVIPVKKLNILATTPTSTPKKPAPKPLLKSPINQVGWGVKAIYGDTLNELPTGGEGVKVAVLDTGVTAHSDLKSQVILCDDFASSEGFVKNSCEDKNGHGTQVAGVIAANGGADGKGIYGVAPQASLMIYKVCGADGTCFADDVAAAIHHATDNGANIILLSLGSDTASSLMNDAILYANNHDVLIVAAAGNDGPYLGTIDYPASRINVVSVGAVDSSLTIPDWSARGSNTASSSFQKYPGDLDVVAPGVNIETTSNNNDYVTLSGTSVAAAHIAGLIAKEWPMDADHPVEMARDILHKLSQDMLPLGDDPDSGWGMPSL